MASKTPKAERLAAIRDRFPQATEAQAKLIDRRHGRFNAQGEFVKTAEHGTANVQQLPGGREVSTTRSFQAAERTINAAAKAGEAAAKAGKPGPRIVVEVWDKHHRMGRDKPLHAWDNLPRPGGWNKPSPGWSAKNIKAEWKASRKSLRDFLESGYFAEAGDDTEGSIVQPEGISAIQITVYP